MIEKLWTIGCYIIGLLFTLGFIDEKTGVFSGSSLGWLFTPLFDNVVVILILFTSVWFYTYKRLDLRILVPIVIVLCLLAKFYFA